MPGCLVGGSSPRPWGTHGTRHALQDRARFIPTPVGNAPTLKREETTWPVHPHARGERVTVQHLHSAPNGSSPRPWGTHLRHSRRPGVPRFIPTPVGNATGCRSSGRRETVHPHARGERAHCWLGVCESIGSSPRPWGTPGPTQARSTERRFIPTPVGNAICSASLTSPKSVHPHARGERGGPGCELAGAIGSSPRPWGTRAV